MKILIAYATSEGHTRKIAERIASHLQETGHVVQLADTTQPAAVQLSSNDKVVVAASVHQERHQEAVEMFVLAKMEELKRVPSLFLSVSLSAAFPEGRSDAQRYLDFFLRTTSWEPTRALAVAGALRYGEYDYFKQQIVEHLVLRGRRVPAGHSDFEFTDWTAVFQAVDAFVALGTSSQKTN
jgi:menaquinone-dependent protoporphyrinogen oxidase